MHLDKHIGYFEEVGNFEDKRRPYFSEQAASCKFSTYELFDVPGPLHNLIGRLP